MSRDACQSHHRGTGRADSHHPDPGVWAGEADLCRGDGSNSCGRAHSRRRSRDARGLTQGVQVLAVRRAPSHMCMHGCWSATAPACWREGGGQSIARCSRSEALISGGTHSWPLLDPRQQCDASEGCLCHLKHLELRHPPRPGPAVDRDWSAGADQCRAVDGDGDISGYGHDLLAPRDRGGAGADGGMLMDFTALRTQVIALLQREQRLSYRALQRQFALDDEDLEALKDELIYAKRLAVDEEGRVLVWIGETSSAPTTA